VTANLTAYNLAIPLVLFFSYVLLVTLVIVRRGLQGREPSIFVVYLTVATMWFLFVMQNGLRVIWPFLPCDRVAIYLLLALSVMLWSFTRAFLQKPPLPVGGWLPAVVVAVALIATDAGLVTVPPVSPTIGAFAPTDGSPIPVFGTRVAAVVYIGAAVVTALTEYFRRPSPLHRNRIMYWLLSAALLLGGLALALTRSAAVELGGAGLHWLGAALATYFVVQTQLPNIAVGVRRGLSYFVVTLVPVAIAVGLGLGLAYLIGLSPLFRLRLNEDFFFGTLVTGAIVFVLYQPLSHLTRSAVDRLLFGRGYSAQRVVSQYGQAVSQIISLDELTAKAMEIIDGVLGIQRGTLLVVDDKREDEWQLRVIKGLNVPADQPPLTLRADTPLSKWLVDQGVPLHQYTMDVDAQFDALGDAERKAWRELDMEVFVPVRRSGALIGLAAVGLRRSGQPYSGADLELLRTLADQTAVALENASLFSRVQRRAEQLTLLNEVGRAITSAVDLEPVVNLIAGRIEDAFKIAAGFIFLLDEPRGEMVLQSAFGRDAPKLDTCRIKVGKGLVGWVAEQAVPLLVPDLSGDSHYAQEVEGVLAAGAKSAMCVPVLARGKTIGVIMIVDPARASFSSMGLSLLDSIASFASIAIENARQVAVREAQLRRKVEELQIQIDEFKRAQEVKDITDTEYFRSLQARAHQIREKRASREKKG
jgi:GAF domain-containing protein